jgi:hypothetical protein
MLSEIEEPHLTRKAFPNEDARDVREKDLPPVGSRGDARRSVDIDAEVVIPTQNAFACVHAHPHSKRGSVGPVVAGQLALGLDNRPDGLDRAAEHGEERIAFGPDNCALLLAESTSHDLGVVLLHAAVLLAELLEKASGALDVGEEKGHRAGGKLGHTDRQSNLASETGRQ